MCDVIQVDGAVVCWNPASNSEAGGHDLEGEGTGGDDASELRVVAATGVGSVHGHRIQCIRVHSKYSKDRLYNSYIPTERSLHSTKPESRRIKMRI